MPIIVDPQKLSMPEQVQQNKDDIENIYKKIDGLDSLDNVVEVPDISHVLTSQELKAIEQPVAFIIYSNKVYLKRKIESGIAYFDRVFSIYGSTVITFDSEEIQATLSNGALAMISNSFSTYSKSEIDSKFSTINYVDNNFAKLSGANFTGGIRAPSIIEDMSGYSFQPQTPTNYTITPIYAGVVKTGNKITFVAYLEITKIADNTGDYNPTIARFGIPSSIGEKLYPSAIGAYPNLLDCRNNIALEDTYTGVAINCGVNKTSNTILDMYLFLARNLLVAGTKYKFRYEATFLLSDNLAQ